MEWAIAAVVAAVLSVAVFLAYYFIVGPQQYAAGADSVTAEQKVKADAQAALAQSIEKVVNEEFAKLDELLAEKKSRDPVNFANDLIAKKEKKS